MIRRVTTATVTAATHATSASPLCGGGCRACGANATGQDEGADPCSAPENADDVTRRLPEIMADIARRATPKQLAEHRGTGVEAYSFAPQPLPHTAFRREEFGWLMAVAARSHFVLTDQGREMVRRCDGERSLGQIIDEIAAEYPGQKEEVQTGVWDFFQRLGMLNLIGWRQVEGPVGLSDQTVG